jgi:hypothetical protein
MKCLKRYLIVTCGILLLTSSMKAQSPISGGIVGAVNTGAVRISDVDSVGESVIEGNTIPGFALGLYGKAALGPFYVRPEVAYNFKSGRVRKLNGAETSAFNMHKFEVPLMLGLKFLGPVCVEAGPVWNYVLDATDRFNEDEVDLVKSGMGYRLGAGLDFGRAFFSLSYQGATYNAKGGSDKTTFKEPYKMALNIGLRLGGG